MLITIVPSITVLTYYLLGLNQNCVAEFWTVELRVAIVEWKWPILACRWKGLGGRIQLGDKPPCKIR